MSEEPRVLYQEEKHTALITLNRAGAMNAFDINCLLYTSPSPRDRTRSRMPSSA